MTRVTSFVEAWTECLRCSWPVLHRRLGPEMRCCLYWVRHIAYGDCDCRSQMSCSLQMLGTEVYGQTWDSNIVGVRGRKMSRYNLAVTASPDALEAMLTPRANRQCEAGQTVSCVQCAPRVANSWVLDYTIVHPRLKCNVCLGPQNLVIFK